MSINLTQPYWIGPIPYELELVPQLENPEGTQKLSGYIDFQHTKIQLDAGLSEPARELVLLHEAIHGILTHAGYENAEERLVESLALGVLGLINDNYLPEET